LAISLPATLDGGIHDDAGFFAINIKKESCLCYYVA
jgi:hypothetical protein